MHLFVFFHVSMLLIARLCECRRSASCSPQSSASERTRSRSSSTTNNRGSFPFSFICCIIINHNPIISGVYEGIYDYVRRCFESARVFAVESQNITLMLREKTEGISGKKNSITHKQTKHRFHIRASPRQTRVSSRGKQTPNRLPPCPCPSTASSPSRLRAKK